MRIVAADNASKRVEAVAHVVNVLNVEELNVDAEIVLLGLIAIAWERGENEGERRRGMAI